MYIAPHDSPFFTMEAFAYINKLSRATNDNMVILGDFNARMCNLNRLSDPINRVSYANYIDAMQNSNGLVCIKPSETH